MWPSSTSASATCSAAHSIIDELADRDRHKKNIIIYNLPEATDHAADKVSFLGLCKTVFNLDVLVTWVTHSGKDWKTSTDPYWCVLHIKMTKWLFSHSNLGCHHNQFEKVFIAPYWTKFEQEKHVKLVNELKERKAKG